MRLLDLSATEISGAGKRAECMYLSKSASNSEKRYSNRSKSTRKKLYLKYGEKVNNRTWSTPKSTFTDEK